MWYRQTVWEVHRVFALRTVYCDYWLWEYLHWQSVSRKWGPFGPSENVVSLGWCVAPDFRLLLPRSCIQRLRWFQSHDYRPAEHKVKDYDIIHDVLLELKLRSDSSSRTLLAKVHGHSGDPLHEEADRIVVEGADKRKWRRRHFISRRPRPKDGFQLGWWRR